MVLSQGLVVIKVEICGHFDALPSPPTRPYSRLPLAYHLAYHLAYPLAYTQGVHVVYEQTHK